MKSTIIDLKGRGFGCRIEKLDPKLAHKSLFMGNIYPKDETYILKIGIIDSTSSLGFKFDSSPHERLIHENGFAIGINNIRRVVQCLIKEEADHTMSYQALVQKILLNLSSHLASKVWPNIKTILENAEEIKESTNKDKENRFIQITRSDGNSDNTEAENLFTLIDNDVTVCKSVLINLIIADDDMSGRVNELNDAEMKSYFKQHSMAYNTQVEKNNESISDPISKEQPKKLIITLIQAKVSKDFFKEKIVLKHKVT